MLGARKRARRRGDARRADEICRERVFVVLVLANAEARRERARDEHWRQGDAATIAEVGIESRITTAVDAAVEPTTDARDAGQRRPRCRRSTRER